LKNGSNKRDAKWSESIVAGDKEFISEVKTKLGQRPLAGNQWRIMGMMNSGNPKLLTTLFLPLKSVR